MHKAAYSGSGSRLPGHSERAAFAFSLGPGDHVADDDDAARDDQAACGDDAERGEHVAAIPAAARADIARHLGPQREDPRLDLAFLVVHGVHLRNEDASLKQDRRQHRRHSHRSRYHAAMSRALLALLCALSLAASAQTYRSDEHSFRIVKLVEGLDHPWSLAFLPDGRMLVTERPGRLNLLSKDFQRANVEGVPRVFAQGQGGLLEVALHPQFDKNGVLYLSYAGPGAGGASTELARARLNDNRLEDTRVIFRQEPKTRGGLHFGGRIVFDRAGFLYLTLGERGDKDRAQRPENHHGSVIRLHDDGRVPDDNPFVGKPGWKPEKFTLGNRNMQGAALQIGRAHV